MRRLLQFDKIILLVLLLGMSPGLLRAQTTITASYSSYSSGSGANSYLTFVVENTNSYAIVISDIDMYRSSTSNGNTYSLYYSSTSLSGPTGVTAAANSFATASGWTSVSSAALGTITTAAIYPMFTNLNLLMPANTVWRFAVQTNGSSFNYGGAATTPNSFTNGGVVIGTGNYQINGQNVGYWGASTNPRFWSGSVTFAPAAPCTSPPIAGNATVSNPSPCPGEVIELGLTGGTGGLTQTYEWQISTSPTGPFTSISLPLSSHLANDTMGTTPGTVYYRCMVDCGSSISYSDTIAVTISTPFPGGTYTIDAGSPASSTNFQSFSDAIAAISCGITSAITFNVAPGSGPYTEQIELPATIGSDATKTVTFNGNGNTLTMSSPAGGNNATVNIDGADYISFNDLTIEALGSTGFGVHLMNGADHNSFRRCTINASPTGTSTTSGAVSMSGSATSYSTGGTNGSNNLWDSCTISGGYFSFYLYSVSGAAGDSMNNITNCTIKDFYTYGIYNYYQKSATISNNVIHRATRTPVSTCYALYLSTGCTNMLVEKNTLRDMFALQPINTNTAYLIYVTSDGTVGRENKLFNNQIYNIQGSGTLYGMYLSGADHIQVYHNTIVLDDINATAGTTRGIYSTGTTGGIDIQNNIVYITRGGSGDKHCLYFTGAGAKNCNYNDLYIASSSGNNNIGYNGSDQATLSAWQAATGAGSPYDANSLDIDPVFINAISGSYAPANALLDNMGTPLAAVADDITGAARDPFAPDMGAYEFAVPLCSGKPDSATAAGPASICSTTPFTVYATGLSIGVGITYDWQYNDGSGWFSTGGTNTSYTEAGGIFVPTDYRVVTYCANSNQYDTSSVWSVTLTPFYFCYCSPLTGNTLHTSTSNYMTNVEIAGTSLNNSTSAIGAGGYTQTDPTVSNQTGTVFINVPFVLNTTQSTTLATTEAWFDWDQNGFFDAYEYYALTSTGTAATASITPPVGALTGMTGMRIRVAYNSAGAYGSGAACTNISAGRETEDYVINVMPTPTCPQSSLLAASNVTTNSADLSWSYISTASTWEIEYAQGVSSFAQGSGTPIYTGTMPYTLSGLSPNTVYTFYIRDICTPGDTSYRAGPYTFITAFPAFPPNDSCGAPVDISDGQLYAGNNVNGTPSMPACNTTAVPDDVWYTFTTGSTGGSVTVTVTTITSGDVVIQALTGTCGGTMTPMIPTASTTLGSSGCIDGPAAGVEFGTYTVAANTTYYVRVYSFTNTPGSFTIQATGAPLAIKLEKLTAMNAGAANKVEWTTLSEERSDKFELERSADGKHFAKIYEKQANGEASRYTYMDNNPIKGMNYYRLRMTEANGQATYSEVVTAFVKSNGFEVNAYPNPVSHDLTVHVSGVQGADATLQVMDITGKVIRTVKMTGNVETLDMSSLANGIYLIKYSDADHTQTIRVSKQ